PVRLSADKGTMGLRYRGYPSRPLRCRMCGRRSRARLCLIHQATRCCARCRTEAVPAGVAACDSREYVRTSGGSAARQDRTDGCISERKGSMRDVAKWIRGMPANAANHRLPGDAVLGTGLADVIAERANHGLLVVTRGTERLNDEAGAPIHVLEDEPAATILFVG